MKTQTTAPQSKPILFKILDFCLDRLFPPVRRLLYPFHLIVELGFQVRNGIWLLRNEFIKSRLSECGKGVRLHGRFTASALDMISLEDNVHINDNAFIRAEGGLRIGENTHISRNLVLYTMNHDYQGSLLPYDSGKVLKPVHIGKNVWIGMNVCITPGSRIGDGAIIGMGAVVSGEIKPLTIVGSPPVRVLKERDPDHYDRLESNDKYSGMSGYPLR